MGALLSSLSSCLGCREEEQQPTLLEHYHRIHMEMTDMESLLESRVRNSRCC